MRQFARRTPLAFAVRHGTSPLFAPQQRQDGAFYSSFQKGPTGIMASGTSCSSLLPSANHCDPLGFSFSCCRSYCSAVAASAAEVPTGYDGQHDDANAAATKEKDTALVAKILSLHKDFASKRDRATLAEARKLLETETIENVENVVDYVGSFLTAVNAFRPNILSTRSVGAVMSYLSQSAVVDSGAVSVAAASRVMHAAVVMHVPGVFDLLLAWLWKVVDLAPQMDSATVATCINAFGRAGVRHPALYRALNAQALQVMQSPVPPLSHIANVLHALSRVKVFDEAVFKMLCEHAAGRRGEVTPLVLATVLDACATVGYSPDFIFVDFEKLAVEQAKEFSAQLLASVVTSVAKVGRTESPVLEALADRGIEIVSTFDPPSIAKTLDAYRLVDHRHEDFFGCLAERSCKLVPEFRLEEIKQTLVALSHFELFDAELFPLLASKVVNITRGRASFEFSHVAQVLRAFAKVHERNDEFISALAPVIKANLPSLSDDCLVDLLYSYAVFGIRSEVAQALLKELDRLSEETKSAKKDDLVFITTNLKA